MARMVRCGLIQARNVLGAEHSLGEIRDAMVRKHVEMIEQAAQAEGADPVSAGVVLWTVFLRRAGPALVRTDGSRVPDGPTVG